MNIVYFFDSCFFINLLVIVIPTTDFHWVVDISDYGASSLLAPCSTPFRREKLMLNYKLVQI